MTTTDALVFLETGQLAAPEPLLHACRSAQLRVAVTPLPSSDSFREQLPSGDRLLLLPLIEQDELSLRLAEAARSHDSRLQVLLYCRQLPAAEYWSQAVEHGVRDVLALNLGPSALCKPLLRARRDSERRRQQEDQRIVSQVLREDLQAQVASLQKLQRDQARRYSELCGLTVGLATGRCQLEPAESRLYVLTESVEFREAVCSIGESLGMHVERCYDADDCCDRVERHPAAILVCDHQVDSMSATELCRRARMHQGDHHLSVIAWANGESTDRELLLNATGGVDDFLVAPAESHPAIGAALLLALVRAEGQLSGN